MCRLPEWVLDLLRLPFYGAAGELGACFKSGLCTLSHLWDTLPQRDHSTRPAVGADGFIEGAGWSRAPQRQFN